MRWLFLGAALIVVSASISGVGVAPDTSDAPEAPNEFAFASVESCSDYVDPDDWSAAARSSRTAVSTRFALAANACSADLGQAVEAASTGLDISADEAMRRLVEVTRTE